MTNKNKTNEPSTPSMVESAAMHAAEVAVAAERRSERQQVFAKGTRILGTLALFALLAGGAALFFLFRSPVAPPASSPVEVSAVTDVGVVEFVATADDGRTAGWTYQSPIRSGASLLRGKAGDRHVDVVGPAAAGAALAAGLTGPAPSLLPFTQQGAEVVVVVDGVEKKLRFETWDEACVSETGRTTRQWRLCEVAGGEPACVVAPELKDYCLTAEPRLVSLCTEAATSCG